MTATATGRIRRVLLEPMDLGRRRLPPLALVVLAAVGAALLIVVAFYRWATPSDEHAYWLAARRLLAGEALYDPTATPVTPYAYWYPPPLAQVLAPVAAVLPSLWFTAAWTGLMLVCLWWLSGRDLLVALALVAFPPVAVEFWFRNIHLILAVLLVLAIRGAAWSFPVGAAIKLAPGIGVAWLAGRGRWLQAAYAVVVGLVILVVSALVSPQAWADWIDIALSRGPDDVASFLPFPYVLRAVAGVALAVVATRLRVPWDGIVLVAAVTLALPTLWFTALSVLIAIIPLLRSSPDPGPSR